MELFVILLGFLLDFFLTAFAVWAIFGLLGVLGITTIGGFVLTFSWKTAFILWIVVILLRILFRSASSK